jgi:hypothetical protein
MSTFIDFRSLAVVSCRYCPCCCVWVMKIHKQFIYRLHTGLYKYYVRCYPFSEVYLTDQNISELTSHTEWATTLRMKENSCLFIMIYFMALIGNIIYRNMRVRPISLWLYKENNRLRDWKNVFALHISPLSSTHLWLRCSNFWIPFTKNCFDCAANRKIGKVKDLSAPLRIYTNLHEMNNIFIYVNNVEGDANLRDVSNSTHMMFREITVLP